MIKPGRFFRGLILATVAFILAYFILVVLVRPSNKRDWSADAEKTATAVFSGDSVQIDNVRNARYRSTTDFDVYWETRAYDLRKIESVWFVVEPFSDWRGPAHTFLSFGFSNGEYIAVSVEIRKEKNESFSPLAGLFRQYELIYVIGDERDLIGLRANYRNDEVYLYEINATPDKRLELFISILQRANEVAKKPEFYNTLSNTCTSNIVDHIDTIAPGRVPFSIKTYLPAYSDELAFDLGLINTSLARNEFRAAHKINALAKQHADSAKFSEAIRKGR